MDVFYDTKGNIRNLNGLKTGKTGNCGEIFRDGNVHYKKYFYGTACHERLKYDVWKVLQAIDNSHLVNIFELLYNQINVFSRESLLEDIQEFCVDGYLYDWVVEEKVDVIGGPIEYLWENMYELFCLGEVFSGYRVFMGDVKRENSVITKSGIVLIDPDLFMFNNPGAWDLEVENYNNQSIIELFEQIIYSEARKRQIDVDTEEIFDGLESKENLTVVTKRFGKYKTLEEYIAKK